MMGFFGVVLALFVACPSVVFAVETAPVGVPITGVVGVKTAMMPEPGVFEAGYVQVAVREDFTGKVFLFTSEDSTCAILMAYAAKNFACPREAEKTKFKALSVGSHVRISQEISVIDGGRRLIRLAVL